MCPEDRAATAEAWLAGTVDGQAGAEEEWPHLLLVSVPLDLGTPNPSI